MHVQSLGSEKQVQHVKVQELHMPQTPRASKAPGRTTCNMAQVSWQGSGYKMVKCAREHKHRARPATEREANSYKGGLTMLCRSCLPAILLLSCSSRRPKAEAMADTVFATPLTVAPALPPPPPLLTAATVPLIAEVSVVAIDVTSVKVRLAACESCLLPRVFAEEATAATATRKTCDTACTSEGGLMHSYIYGRDMMLTLGVEEKDRGG